MASPPKLKRADDCDENVEHERSRSNDCGCESKQSHRRDVAGRARVSDRRIEKRDQSDREAKESEVCRVHLSFVVEALVPSACLFNSVLENKHRYNCFRFCVPALT
jgi:hypothetical protein